MARKKVVLMSDTHKILEKMGTNIKRARLRRNISAEHLAEQAQISTNTLTAIEKGAHTVSLGAYAAVLSVLGMEKDLEQIARDTERDNFMSAEEAKEYGLVDEVIASH